MEYLLQCRGEYYHLNDDGEFKVSGKYSPTWKVKGIAKRWNSNYVRPWELLKQDIEDNNIVEGYLYDLDHGTTRMWAGSYCGHIPKARITKR